MAGNEVSTTPVLQPSRIETAQAKTAQAQRALSEAKARRDAAAFPRDPKPLEVNGREGPDPVRYGDWENKGIASDF